jgi:DNA-binding MarR family transcriptional regulator
MNEHDSHVNDLLLEIFENILVTEQKALRRGSFSDLSIAEMHTLEGIGLYDAHTMSETAARLEITTGTLTVAVDKLVKKGYVERLRDEADRRIFRVCLTRKGKLAYRMHTKFHTLLVERLLLPLDDSGRRTLVQTLETIAAFTREQYRRYNITED